MQAEAAAAEQLPSSAPSPLLQALTSALADALAASSARIATRLHARLQKADPDPEDLASACVDEDAPDLAADLQQPAFIEPLALAVSGGGVEAALTLGYQWNVPQMRAIAYARDRAAEMVGMRRRPDGSLVPNPTARWRITDTTRERLASLVQATLEDGSVSYRTLIDSIQDQPGWNTLFGEYRAEMIARTELAMATNVGHTLTYESAGFTHVRVLDNEACKICGPVAGTVQTLAWARENPTGHPHCIRALTPVTPTNEEES